MWTLILISLGIGIVLAPKKAFSLNYGTARLDGVVWPLPATAVGRYMAELTGMTILLWACGAIRRKPALLLIGAGFVALIASHTRGALVGMVLALVVAGLSLFAAKRRVRQAFAISLVVVITVVLPLTPVLSSWLTRGQSTEAVHSLSGRTSYWHYVLTEPRPETNKIFGSGMTNDGVQNNVPGQNGLPIDSSWLASYQNQGVVGCIIEGLIIILLLTKALQRPRGIDACPGALPHRLLFVLLLHRDRNRRGLTVSPRSHLGCLPSCPPGARNEPHRPTESPARSLAFG